MSIQHNEHTGHTGSFSYFFFRYHVKVGRLSY